MTDAQQTQAVPNSFNPFDNSYQKYKIDSSRLITTINRRFRGMVFREGAWQKQEGKPAILSDWAAEWIFATVEPYLETNITLSSFDKFYIAKTLQTLYKNLYIVLLQNIDDTGLKNQYELRQVVDVVVDVVSGSMNRAKEGLTLKSEKTTVAVSEQTQTMAGAPPTQQQQPQKRYW